MSSADQQAEERKVGVRKLSVGQVQKVGEDVPLQMIDLHQRNVVGDRESFGERYAHQKRSQQTGAARESDRVDLVDRHAGLFQGRIDYRDDILLVGPDASSGITPPYFWCTACEAITFERSVRSRMTAAEVSSQEDSMPKMVMSM